MNELSILGLSINNLSKEEILNNIIKSVKNNYLFSFLNINSYILLEQFKDGNYRKNLSVFTELYPDGIGIYWALRILYGIKHKINLITGTDLYEEIISTSEKYNFNLLFLGGMDISVKNLKIKLFRKYSSLKIVGVYSRNTIVTEQFIETINNSKADIIFIGLGTPLQENFLMKFSQKLNIPVKIACGSGIDYLSGELKRAPLFMRKAGLEWLFRLVQNPGRLWKRYILGIPLFIF